MTAPEVDPVLTVRDELEASYGLTGQVLGLSPGDLDRRITLWLGVAARRTTASTAQQAAHVRVLALTGWITRLMGGADKFRAEGDLTVEKNNMARIALVQGWIDEAKAEAGLIDADVVGGNPSPEFTEWGLRP